MTTRLTAEELSITQAEHDALVWVRDALDPTISDHDLPAWMRFDMGRWGSAPCGSVEGRWGGAKPLEDVSLQLEDDYPSCGTACCIGGSMQMHMVGLTKLHPGDLIPHGLFETFEQTLVGELLPSSKKPRCPMWALFYENDGNTGREGAVEAIDRFFAGNTENPWQV